MTDTIIVADDDCIQRRLLTALLSSKLGYNVIEASNGHEALEHVQSSNIGDICALLLDLEMPGMSGFEVLGHLRKHRPDLPVLILTGKSETNVAVKAIKEGASDFIVKPADPEQLMVALRNAIRLSSLSRELARLKRDRDGALAFHDLIGHDGGLANAIDYSHKAATSDVPVLLTGPISAGKELLARAIHGQSRRTGAPFITVHCGSVSANALEAILFGEETPHSRTIGKLREAERGTIFLDEIHTLPLNIQSKLLRVLQHREIEPIGTKKPVKVNVRIISATHHDLKAEMRTGNFREDLYFSLNVLTIAVPSLRERKQDIIPLAEHFLQHYSSLDALPLRSLSADARHYLTDYLWPGNIRELEGLIHRALVLGEGDTIDTRLLKQIHEADAVEGITGEHALHMNLRKPDGFFKTMDQIEKEVMDQALDYYQHNIAHAAQALGMAKSTFYRKLKE